jgi:hypothetical protein
MAEMVLVQTLLIILITLVVVVVAMAVEQTDKTERNL